MRKRRAVKRDVLPDPLYNSKVVTKLINSMMIGGKRGKAQSILYSAFDMIKEKTGKEPMEVFNQALENIKPALEVKARELVVLTIKYQLRLGETRSQALGLRWLVNYAR